MFPVWLGLLVSIPRVILSLLLTSSWKPLIFAMCKFLINGSAFKEEKCRFFFLPVATFFNITVAEAEGLIEHRKLRFPSCRKCVVHLSFDLK